MAIEPRMERSNKTSLWHRPEIVDVVAGKVRLVNDTDDPKHLHKNEQFCQMLPSLKCDELESLGVILKRYIYEYLIINPSFLVCGIDRNLLM